MQGDIFISMFNNSWISRQIAKAIGGWSSHSFIIRSTWNIEELHSTFETTNYQVANRIFEDEYFVPECKMVGYHIKTRTRAEKFEAMRKIDPLIDATYGYHRMLGYLIKKAFKLKNNPCKGGVWCTTIPILYLRALGFKFAFEIKDYNTDTKILQDILDSYPNIFQKRWYKDYNTIEMVKLGE